MPLIAYLPWNPGAKAITTINMANEIISSYREQGFDLTLRQLYYQFVSRDLTPNTERSYKNLGTVIDKARKAGMIDWEAIVDRTRSLRGNNHWESPSQIVRACAVQFRYDLWENQENRVEVWIEKDALVGVIQGVCSRWDVDYFACRGYNSQSEQWRAGRRLKRYREQGQNPIVLHLGDHDPSGIDMTDDNRGRLTMFSGDVVEVRRLALNMDQVEQYGPPPNPTKLSDSRAEEYVRRFGHECWELDALEPRTIVDLIDRTIAELVDPDQREADEQRQHEARMAIETVADSMRDE